MWLLYFALGEIYYPFGIILGRNFIWYNPISPNHKPDPFHILCLSLETIWIIPCSENIGRDLLWTLLVILLVATQNHKLSICLSNLQNGSRVELNQLIKVCQKNYLWKLLPYCMYVLHSNSSHVHTSHYHLLTACHIHKYFLCLNILDLVMLLSLTVWHMRQW